MVDLSDRLVRLKEEYGELNEEAILLVIDEKIKRYQDLRKKISGGELRETAGVIDAINKLENSIVEAIEKYLKLKYPARYSLRLVKESDDNKITKEEAEELKELIEMLSKSSGKRKGKGKK